MTEIFPPVAPKVTAIMLAYNQEAYVAEAVASLLAQEYADLQIIFSDDNSTDATLGIIEGNICKKEDRAHRVITFQHKYYTHWFV